MVKMMHMITMSGTGRATTQEAMSKGIRVTAKKRPNIMAPATITITMQETRRVSVMEAMNPFQLSLRCKMLIRTANSEPTAPASVGVKKPK